MDTKWKIPYTHNNNKLTNKMTEKNKNPFELSAEEKRRQIDDMWNNYEKSRDSNFESDNESIDLDISRYSDFELDNESIDLDFFNEDDY